MNKNIHFHLSYYLLLFTLIATGLIFFLGSAGNPQRQYLVVIIISVFYFLLGMYRHYQEGDLHIKIVVEYLLIALLAIILLRGAIFH